MPARSTHPSDLVARIRTWWDASTYLGDVALLFTIVTVGNSVMMLTGLDEPKTGTFAYIHLLGRLGIITLLVGLFYLDEGREWLVRRRSSGHHPGRTDRPRGSARSILDDVRRSLLRGGLGGTARVFTAVVAATCVVVVALEDVWSPVGGRELYRNLVLFALVLLPIMLIASRWERHRASARGPKPD